MSYWHDYIKAEFNENAKLCYMDTDMHKTFYCIQKNR